MSTRVERLTAQWGLSKSRLTGGIVARALASRGRAFLTFVAIGIPVALLNFACVWLFSRQGSLPYVGYVLIATEISILASFLLNDRFTFHDLPGHRRRWSVRCLRFHETSVVGALLTIAVSSFAHYLLRFPPVLAQVVAVGGVAVVNFTMHHLWTYRQRDKARPTRP